jgi:hypothetical protein
MFGQSAIIGRIAGATTGFLCDCFGVGEEEKRAAQAFSCSIAGSFMAGFTLDLVGGALNAAQTASYATGKPLPESVLTDTLTLLKKNSPG